MSLRRAAFYAAVARQRGETANRNISVEPDWAIPLALEATIDDAVLADMASPDEAVPSGDDTEVNSLPDRIDR